MLVHEREEAGRAGPREGERADEGAGEEAREGAREIEGGREFWGRMRLPSEAAPDARLVVHGRPFVCVCASEPQPPPGP